MRRKGLRLTVSCLPFFLAANANNISVQNSLHPTHPPIYLPTHPPTHPPTRSPIDRCRCLGCNTSISPRYQPIAASTEIDHVFFQVASSTDRGKVVLYGMVEASDTWAHRVLDDVSPSAQYISSGPTSWAILRLRSVGHGRDRGQVDQVASLFFPSRRSVFCFAYFCLCPLSTVSLKCSVHLVVLFS